MNDTNNATADLYEALMSLNDINAHVVILTTVGMTQEARGAACAWLDGAIRVAITSAETREAAAFKINLLAGNMYGWAMQASKENGLTGAVGLIFGGLHADAREWGVEVPKNWEGCSVDHPGDGVDEFGRGYADVLDPGVVASYRKEAKRRRLGPAIKRYEEVVAEIDAVAASGQQTVEANVIRRSREALLDVMAVSTRDVAQLERKVRAYVAFRDTRNRCSWLLENAVSVAIGMCYHQLGLPPGEIARLKGMFPIVWTSETRPDAGLWTRTAGATH